MSLSRLSQKSHNIVLDCKESLGLHIDENWTENQMPRQEKRQRLDEARETKEYDFYVLASRRAPAFLHQSGAFVPRDGSGSSTVISVELFTQKERICEWRHGFSSMDQFEENIKRKDLEKYHLGHLQSGFDQIEDICEAVPFIQNKEPYHSVKKNCQEFLLQIADGCNKKRHASLSLEKSPWTIKSATRVVWCGAIVVAGTVLFVKTGGLAWCVHIAGAYCSAHPPATGLIAAGADAYWKARNAIAVGHFVVGGVGLITMPLVTERLINAAHGRSLNSAEQNPPDF